jgi:hypothetical protein
MIASTESMSQVGQFLAARDAEIDGRNADRLDVWQRRYPHDVVPVPQASQPPLWPVSRSSMAAKGNVTILPSVRRK